MVQTRGLLPRRAAWQTAIFHSLSGSGLDIDGESVMDFPVTLLLLVQREIIGGDLTIQSVMDLTIQLAKIFDENRGRSPFQGL